ncbi:FadR/GntR family transcriptional regulator [Parapedobacter indicus]|uniref:DNA-binding transcriptional regulator, FadR family n=1 Tax=Parapedobacter indicus TaxID=1477437 RepID=A0A1I3D9B8_9SPHI|nr:GntR family transcriptional regulator [Parapedobacter indicus]PPL04575.1 DNA-binding FadR family transcriptional regulator [Parapedobacter indicus]SFH83189.1 DNA-binding transcriptional regulator, FadR family [Parapedobacter indicus]
MANKNLSRDIERIAPSTMADVVETRLREYLKKKAFKPGDALPKELELAEALDVSRNVVREALSRLRMLGMIESRKKRGMVLAEPDILGGFERVMDPLILDVKTLQDLFELRLVLEMGLADILFTRLTEKDLIDLEQIVNKEVNKVQKPFKVKHEIAFHGKLYQMTGNDTFRRFQNMLLPVFEYVVSEEAKINGEAKVGKVTHRDLLELLKKGDPEDFRKGMKEHLSPHFERVRK